MDNAVTPPSLSTQLLILPWIICSLAALFYCYEYLLRIAPSVMMQDLMQAYHINATVFGNLAAFYYYAYTPMQLPVGVLMDRYGPRRLLTFACLSCAIGSYLFAHAFHIGIAQIGRFLVGFGSAFAFVGVLKLATIWLPPQRFAMIAGLTTSLGMVGGMVGDIYLTALVNQIGWRATVSLSAGAGIVLAIIMYIVIRDNVNERDSSIKKEKRSVDFKEIFVGALQIFKKPQIWLCGVVGCFLYLSLTAFAELWGIPYLKAAHGLSSQQAAVSISMVFLGWTFGGPLTGWISDTMGRRLLPVIIGSIGGGLTIAALLYLPFLSLFGINLLLFLFGLFASAEVIVFAIARESCPANLAASALAIVNMMIMLGGVLFQPLTGYFLDLSWTGGMVDGVRNYTLFSYRIALLTLPIAFVLAALLAFFMRETHCRVVE
jgi:MFS family permease